jgi:hypothetical protein
MLYDEFLKGTGKEPSEGMNYAYKVINQLYMGDQINSHEDVFNYYSKYKNNFDWVDELAIGHGNTAKKPGHLNGIISEEKAKEIINKEFCFEIDKIEVCSTPYFEAYDFNHIVFMVNRYPRVYSNGTLYDIYN